MLVSCELASCVSAIQVAAYKYRLGGTPKGAKMFQFLVIGTKYPNCFKYDVGAIHMTVFFFPEFQSTKFWNVCIFLKISSG